MLLCIVKYRRTINITRNTNADILNVTLRARGKQNRDRLRAAKEHATDVVFDLLYITY